MNKLILITGASSDIGVDLINSIADKDYTILALYNSSADKLSRRKNVIPLRVDLSSETEVNELVSKINTEYGTLYGFIHLAAPAFSQIRYSKTPWDLFQKDWYIQLKSAHILLKSFLPKMVTAGEGKVVFMLSSCTINVPPTGNVEYTTVKYAMLGFMKALASEYRASGININAVSPSMIDTKFLKNIPSIAVEMAKESHPRKRLATTSDIVPTIEFLISKESQYIHGTNIPITGGESF